MDRPKTLDLETRTLEEKMRTELKNDMFKMGVLAALVAVAMPELSFAQDNFTELASTLADEEVSTVPFVVNFMGYTIGTVMMLSGALSLKKHTENPAGEPLNKGLGRLLIGAGITAIPSILNVMQGTTHLDSDAAELRNFEVGFDGP